MRFAASSSSRIARTPRPNREWRRFLTTTNVRTTKTNVHGSVVSFRIPRNPRGPPTTLTFSSADFTIMLKASVTIAR
jgi:hypothetical protein